MRNDDVDNDDRSPMPIKSVDGFLLHDITLGSLKLNLEVGRLIVRGIICAKMEGASMNDAEMRK